jgi:DNA-binding transcriptional MocR family regulator
LAHDLRTLIRDGGLRPGDPLPSLRDQSRLRRVSLGTVQEAYRLLEAEGLIRAVPQSGFRVVGTGRESQPFTPEVIGLDPSVYGLFRVDRAFKQAHRDPQEPTVANFAVAAGEVPPALLARIKGCCVDILTSRPEVALDYSISPGPEELRLELSRYLATCGAAVPADALSVTSGCTESLTLALRACCREGDAVAVEGPCSFNILSQLVMLRYRPVEVPVGPDGLDLGALAQTLASQSITALIVSPNFNNPTGALMPEAARKDLVDLCDRHGVRIIEDDVYGDLPQGPVRPRPLKALEGRLPILYCSSFSKTLAPGLRVGLLAAGDLQSRVESLGAFTTLAGNSLAQLVVARLLREGDYGRHLRHARRSLAAHFEAMAAVVTEAFPPGTRVSSPAGGLVLWVALPPGLGGQAVYEASLERNVLVAPGNLFSTRGTFQGHIRLNAGVWGPRLEEGLRIVGAQASRLYGSLRA